MSIHKPITMPLFAQSDCGQGACEHEYECPTFETIVCLNCNIAAHGSANPDDWGGPVAPCPIFGTGASRDQVDALMGALAVPAPSV